MGKEIPTNILHLSLDTHYNEKDQAVMFITRGLDELLGVNLIFVIGSDKDEIEKSKRHFAYLIVETIRNTERIDEEHSKVPDYLTIDQDVISVELYRTKDNPYMDVLSNDFSVDFNDYGELMLIDYVPVSVAPSSSTLH